MIQYSPKYIKQVSERIERVSPYGGRSSHIQPAAPIYLSMNNPIAALVAAALVVGALVGGVGPASAQEGRCLDRREIQERIDAGELRQLSEAMDRAGVEGKIISSAAQVCQIGGQWQWRVNVMDSYGESRPVTLPAQ
jgi:hypothetical protein